MIIRKDNGTSCDSDEDQGSAVGGLGDTSVVNHAVVRDAVVAAKLCEGRLKALDVAGNTGPRNDQEEGDDHLKEYEHRNAALGAS